MKNYPASTEGFVKGEEGTTYGSFPFSQVLLPLPGVSVSRSSLPVSPAISLPPSAACKASATLWEPAQAAPSLGPAVASAHHSPALTICSPAAEGRAEAPGGGGAAPGVGGGCGRWVAAGVRREAGWRALWRACPSLGAVPPGAEQAGGDSCGAPGGTC